MACRSLGVAGTAAVEFALLSPLMASLLIGTIEMSYAIRFQAKLDGAAGTLAELVARQSAVVETLQGDLTGSLADLCAGAALNVAPYAAAPFSANIASVTNRSVATVVVPVQDWESDASCPLAAEHAGAPAMLSLANSPRSLLTSDGAPAAPGGSNLVAGYSAIVVRVQYQYVNVLPRFAASLLTFTSVAVARPRSNATIPCTVTPVGASSPVACPQNL